MTAQPALAARSPGPIVAFPGPHAPGAAAGEAAPAFLPALELLLLGLLLRLLGRAAALPACWHPLLRPVLRPVLRHAEGFAPWLVGTGFFPAEHSAPGARPSAALRRARRLAAWAGWIMRFFPARGMSLAAPAPMPSPPRTARAPPCRDPAENAPRRLFPRPTGEAAPRPNCS